MQKVWLESPWVVVSSILLAVILMLHASLSSPFYALDDGLHIQASLTDEWSDFNSNRTSAMPLARFSYRIDYYLFRPATQPPVLSNTVDLEGLNNWAPVVRCMSGLYHLLAAILLWYFLRRIGTPAGVAFLVALVWAGHPCACEAVCWVSERKSVLTALFGFGALLAWTANKRHLWRLPLAYVLFLLAHLSKPSALGLLPVLAALEFLDPEYGELHWCSVKRWWIFSRRLAVPVLLCIGAIAVGLHKHGKEVVAPPGGTLFSAVMTDAEIFGKYAGNTLLPVNLSFYYGIRPIVSLMDYRLWLYGSVLIALFAAAILKTERALRPLALFGLIWFLGALGPTSNLISLAYWMQDRYIYLAMPGLLLSVMLAIRGVMVLRKVEPAWMARTGAAYAVLIFGLLIYRASFFGDSNALELDAAQRQPLSGEARLSAARIFTRQWQENNSGSPSDREKQKMYGYAACAEYEGALKCPDLQNFDEPFAVKLRGVEILLQLGDYIGVQRTLEGWLPPSQLTMLKVVHNDGSNKEFSRRSYLRGYFPQTLSHAWALMAECSVRQSLSANLSPPDRLLLCDRALKEAGQAQAVWDKSDEAQIVTGKILLIRSNAETDNHNPSAGQAQYNKAMEILKSIQPDSPNASVAKYLIANAHPPAAAPPEKP